MTRHIADIASYQGSLSVAQLWEAGFRALNVKVSHGLSKKSVHQKVQTYVQDARAAGMGLLSFHWLDNSASGKLQAEYAYARMKALGLHEDAGHVVDCESSATQVVYMEYCRTMHQLLGREIITYTGDWWWPGWQRSVYSPWLMSAPISGYLTEYPGDQSVEWTAYGPWDEISILQYRVAPVAGIDVSQSAVRSEQLFNLMTGGPMASWVNVPASTSLLAEFNTLAPARNKASDGTIGDSAHAANSSDHNPDETGVTPYSDTDTINEVHARDVDKDLNRAGWTMQRAVDVIVGRHRAGLDNRLQNVIYNRKIASRSWGWAWREYTGSSPHTEHAHFSFRYGSGSGSSNPENGTQPWGLLAEAEKEEGFMAFVENQAQFESALVTAFEKNAVREALTLGVFGADVLKAPAALTSPDNPEWTPHTYLNQILLKAHGLATNGSTEAIAELARTVARLEAAVSALTPPPAGK